MLYENKCTIDVFFKKIKKIFANVYIHYKIELYSHLPVMRQIVDALKVRRRKK